MILLDDDEKSKGWSYIVDINLLKTRNAFMIMRLRSTFLKLKNRCKKLYNYKIKHINKSFLIVFLVVFLIILKVFIIIIVLLYRNLKF